MNPIFVLGSTSPSLQADWEGNSDRNIVDINRIIPWDAQGLLTGMGTDNANDAKKEVSATETKLLQHFRDNNLHNLTRVNGVAKTLKRLGDFFQIDQLLIKHLSEGAMGKTDGDFEQNHHRRVSKYICHNEFNRNYRSMTHLIDPPPGLLLC